ncbi:MAG: hypothetical protein WCP39_00495 [Chlamydiota bacterium]
MKVATIINYCSNEERFLYSCIEGAKPFSSEIIVVVCDHFFDGKLENLRALERVFEAFPEITFVFYPYFDLSKKRIFQKVGAKNFWHCLSRFLGFDELSKDIDWVLFLDADEVVDGRAFSAFLATQECQKYDVMKLANYWYFREPRYRANVWEDSAVWIRKNVVTQKLLLDKEERNVLYDKCKKEKKRQVVGLDQQPMVHHYSWVRSKEEMLRKVESWGHREDKDWKVLIEEEFSHPFLGKDFVHGYSLEEVPSFLQEPKYPKKTESRAHVKKLSVFDVKKKLGWGIFRLVRMLKVLSFKCCL